MSTRLTFEEPVKGTPGDSWPYTLPVSLVSLKNTGNSHRLFQKERRFANCFDMFLSFYLCFVSDFRGPQQESPLQFQHGNVRVKAGKPCPTLGQIDNF